MEEKYINNELRRMAVSCGLCNQWQEDWKNDWNLPKMVDKFFSGIDFYLKTRFVSRQFIMESFPLEFLRENGIIVNDKYSLMNPEHAILIGDSSSTIRVNGFKSATVYVTDNSHLKVYAKNRAFVIVHALDSAEIDGKAYGEADIVIIKHSTSIKITPDESIRIKEELEYLT